jgi:hypothetical protein
MSTKAMKQGQFSTEKLIKTLEVPGERLQHSLQSRSTNLTRAYNHLQRHIILATSPSAPANATDWRESARE